MQKGLVSVVIPNYNYAHYLSETIDSVLSQTYPQVEIIVVDDGSTDGSKEILAGYGGQIRTIFQQNLGVSAARNNGVSDSRGEFIAFLDADDYWLPTKIERQIERFSRDGQLGLVHVGVDEVDADGNSMLERLEGLEGDVSNELLQFKREGVLGGGSGLMVPRKVFDDVGGFDLRLSTSADWDLIYQISNRYPVGFVPEILLKYRVHNSNMHSNINVMEHDMSIAFKKALGDQSTAQSRLCYGILYKTLAGSYFRAGNYTAFVRTAFQSLWFDPANLFYFVKFPIRKLNAENRGPS